MIFPGMDPYLEDPRIWLEVHSSMVVYTRDHLQPLLSPRYVATIEERVYLEGPDREVRPDVLVKRTRADRGGGGAATPEADAAVVVEAPLGEEVHETYVAILDLQAGQRIVTVIEVVSPSNKYAGPGRESYLAKQREVLSSPAHLVEIDLLRQGPHVLAVPEGKVRGRWPYDYLIGVNRAEGVRDLHELYPRRLRDRLPRIRVPLAEGDPDVVLDVQAVLARTHEAGSYRDRLRYDAPCVPPLPAEDKTWADGLIRDALRAGA